jgi:hypothetical protein
LPDAPGATRLARRFLVDALPDDRPDVLDVVFLLTTELVTNAVRHGRAPIRLQLSCTAGTVRVEVHDGGFPFDAPHVVRNDPADGSGHGLGLLAARASSWGSTSNGPAVAGKAVWFELSRTGRDATPPGPDDHGHGPDDDSRLIPPARTAVPGPARQPRPGGEV